MKQDRTKYVGSHDIADIIGVGYNSKFHVQLMKINEEYRQEKESKNSDVVLFRVGKAVEQVICEELLSLFPINTKVLKEKHFKHKKYKFLGSTPDRIFVLPSGEKVCVEFKNTNDKKEWGEAMSDQVPPRVFIQCQWHMLMTGLDKCFVGALFWSSQFVSFLIERDQKIIDDLLNIAIDFWQKYIVEKQQIETDYSDACRWFLKNLYVTEPTKVVEPSAEILKIAENLCAVKKEIAEKEKTEKELLNKMIEFMKDAGKMSCKEWSLSISESKRVTFKDKTKE